MLILILLFIIVILKKKLAIVKVIIITNIQHSMYMFDEIKLINIHSIKIVSLFFCWNSCSENLSISIEVNPAGIIDSS